MKKEIIFKNLFLVICNILYTYIFTLIINLISKAENESVFGSPIESLSNYFFGFSYGLGLLGIIISVLILLVYLALLTIFTDRAIKKIIRKSLLK